jgi:hypothetical protein
MENMTKSANNSAPKDSEHQNKKPEENKHAPQIGGFREFAVSSTPGTEH